MEPALAAPGRLDPFLLPAATTSRFLLLVALTLGAAAHSAVALVGGWEQRYLGCAEVADLGGEALAVTTRYHDCFVGVGSARAAVGLGAAAAVGVGLLLVYLLHPWWKVRRQRLVPLDVGVYPNAAVLGELVGDLPVRFVVRVFRDSRTGRAFGRRGRYVVRLDRGLLVGDVDVLRAVVRHELAHLRNHDVGRTVVTVAAGWVFLGVVVVPQVAYTAFVAPADLWGLSWRLALSTALIFLLAASVIRVREHYADVRGSDGELADAFDEPRARPWSLHPSLEDRRRVVRRPDLLLGAGFGEAVATGITAGLLHPHLSALAAFALPTNSVQAGLLAALPVGALVTTVVGVALWRASFRALALGEPPPGVVRPGLGLAAGLVAGGVVSAAFDSSSWWVTAVRDPVQGLLFAVVLVLGCLVFGKWSVSVAGVWLSGARRLRAALWTGQVVSALALASGLALWTAGVRVFSESGFAWSLPVALFGSTLEPLLALPLLLAAVYPLLAAGRRAVRRRVWLDAPDEVEFRRPRLLVWPVLVVPLVPFAVVSAVQFFVPGGALGYLAQIGSGGGYAQFLSQSYGVVAGILAVELVTVLAVAVLARRAALGPAHGLVAAVLAGELFVVALLGLPAVSLCATACDVTGALRGLGSAYILTGVGALVVTTVVWGPLSSVGAALRRRDRYVEARPARRWPALVGAVVLALLYLVPTGASWAATNTLLPLRNWTSVPDAVRNAADPDPPGTASTRTACDTQVAHDSRPAPVDVYQTDAVELGRQAAASTSPGMRAFGRTLFDAAKAGDERRIKLGLGSITTYCRGFLLGTITAPEPVAPAPAPVVLAFGTAHTWPGGAQIAVAAPLRFTENGITALVVRVDFTNRGSRPLAVDDFSFAGTIGALTVPAFVVPLPGREVGAVAVGATAPVFHSYLLLDREQRSLDVEVTGDGAKVVFRGAIPATDSPR